MPLSSEFKKTSILFKLYSLPSIVLLIGIISYGLIYAKVQKGFYQHHTSASFQQNRQAPYQVAVDVLNVRIMPTTDSAIKAKLYRFETIEVLEIKEGWGKVDGGWVLLAHLQRL